MDDILNEDEDTSNLSEEDLKKGESLLESNTNFKKHLVLNGRTFLHCSIHDKCVNLNFSGSSYVTYDLFKVEGNLNSFDINPIDILGLTTSTATIPRNITTNTYKTNFCIKLL